MANSLNPVVYRGATLNDLVELFGVDRRDVRLKVADIPPRGKFQNQDTWNVREVAGRLAKFDDSQTDLVDRILATHHTDLPKMLSKEYWYGQNQRLRYMRDVGDLWDTAAVVALASEVFKTLRLSLMLSSDAVEREAGLTPKQRDIVENIMHQALFDAREKLVVSLAHQRKNSSGKAFAPKEVVAKRGSAVDDDPFREPVPGDDDYI